ncbi:hypothetical protein MMC30_009074 [Trapelia coarctata]|nr:hypothetical protein [Trapelia coarctata]
MPKFRTITEPFPPFPPPPPLSPESLSTNTQRMRSTLRELHSRLDALALNMMPDEYDRLSAVHTQYLPPSQPIASTGSPPATEHLPPIQHHPPPTQCLPPIQHLLATQALPQRQHLPAPPHPPPPHPSQPTRLPSPPRSPPSPPLPPHISRALDPHGQTYHLNHQTLTTSRTPPTEPQPALPPPRTPLPEHRLPRTERPGRPNGPVADTCLPRAADTPEPAVFPPQTLLGSPHIEIWYDPVGRAFYADYKTGRVSWVHPGRGEGEREGEEGEENRGGEGRGKEKEGEGDRKRGKGKGEEKEKGGSGYVRGGRVADLAE